MAKTEKEIMPKSLQEVERNARARDLKNENNLNLNVENLSQETITSVIRSLNDAGYSVFKPKDKRMKIKFAQIVQNNWKYLLENDLIKNEQIKFLNQLFPYVGFRSNCVIKDINAKVQVPMTQKDIADVLRTSESKVSKVINALRKIGIIAKANIPNHDEGEILKGRSHAIFLNPNVIYSGDKTDIEETLIAMFNNPPEALRALPEQLFILQSINKKD